MIGFPGTAITTTLNYKQLQQLTINDCLRLGPFLTGCVCLLFLLWRTWFDLRIGHFFLFRCPHSWTLNYWTAWIMSRKTIFVSHLSHRLSFFTSCLFNDAVSIEINVALTTGWVMNMEQIVEWEPTDETEVLEENPTTLSTPNLTSPDLILSPGRRGWQPAINRLS
jgi:hypothetical protein